MCCSRLVKRTDALRVDARKEGRDAKEWDEVGSHMDSRGRETGPAVCVCGQSQRDMEREPEGRERDATWCSGGGGVLGRDY